METRTTILTLTRYPEIFSKFADSVDAYEAQCPKIAVTSGGIEDIGRGDWITVRGIEPFVYGRNVNAGIKCAMALFPGNNILLVNDDVEFVEPITKQLEWIMMNAPGAGIVSPQIVGGIGNWQAQHHHHMPQNRTHVEAIDFIPFVCVLLSHKMISMIGLMDEGFTKYGGDDVEYNARAKFNGYGRYIGNQLHGCKVKHGFQGKAFSSSYHRVITPEEQEKNVVEMNARADGLIQRYQTPSDHPVQG